MKLAALALTALLIALQLADAWTTWKGMSTGVSKESNKWLERLRVYIVGLPYGGPWAWLAIAKGWALIVIAFGWWIGLWQTVPGLIALVVIASVYGYVVWKNYKLLHSYKG